MMKNIYKKVKRFTDEKAIIREGDSILVAVSGGPDSVFLLHFLISLSREININVKTAYIHHHLRKDADGELIFVRKLAKSHSIRFFYRNIKINGNTGIEEQARRKRYRALYVIARKTGCNKIATGHTLDDQAETVVMRLLKGTGLAGLRGILPEKHLFKNRNVSIIRPLLCLEKKEILGFFKEEEKKYRIDRSNFSGDFLRNRIRSEVLPLLLKYNPGIKKQLAQMSFLVQDDFAFMEKFAEDTLAKILDSATESVNVKTYRQLDVSLKRLVAALLIEKITGNHYRSFNRIKQFMDYLGKGNRKRLNIKDLAVIISGKEANPAG